MNTFTCEKDAKIVKDTTIRYTQEVYPKTGFTQFVIKCPKYLSLALVARYSNIYGADFYDNNHISLTNEKGIVEVYKEIKKGENLYDTHHSGQSVTQMSYGSNYEFSIVFVKGQFNDYDTFMVNHEQKRVSAMHGYPGAGKDYAKKKNYDYVDVWK
jgi:hypothetical protein